MEGIKAFLRTIEADRTRIFPPKIDIWMTNDENGTEELRTMALFEEYVQLMEDEAFSRAQKQGNCYGRQNHHMFSLEALVECW